MAVAVRNDQGNLQSPDEIIRQWKDRIVKGREARKPLERIWLSNLAFAAGQHWLAWDQRSGQMRHVSELDPSYANRNLYAVNKIREYLMSQLGELSSGDDRPELLATQQGETAENVADELNACVEYAWQHEWQADKALARVRSFVLTMGTAAIRCRFDPQKGPVAGHAVIGTDGQPVTDPATLDHLQQTGAMPDGSLPRFKEVREGRTVWEPYTPFQLLTPPGVTHEDDFPWEIIVRPVLIDDLVDEYGAAAAGLVEDTDVASAAGLTTGQQQVRTTGNPNGTRLRDHVWLYTCFQRPSRKYPEGCKTVIASNQYRLLEHEEQLPYKAPDGTLRSGVTYFHWWRLDDRFNSQAFIEPLKDPQRIINERETQNAEIIPRGLPKVFVHEGDLPQTPRGLPLEVIELKTDAAQPQFFGGIGPGSWMYEDLAHHADNLSHASTLSPLRLGENPASVNTYSQLALLNENESYKRSPILTEHEAAIARLVENGVHDIDQFWPAEKTILVAGDEGAIQEQTFRKSSIPRFFQVKVAKGSAQPRSQAAELTKIDAIWAAAQATGVVAGPNAQKWTEWYAKSLEAGQAQDIPEDEVDSQVAVAHYENTLMHNGEQPVPADHDVMPIHVPIHREALDHARAAGDMETAQRILQHIDLSIQVAAVARKQWRFLDPTDTTDMASDLALDEDQALRENEMLIAGQPLNPEEFQQALASLRHGTNPETGQPVTSQDDLQGILQRAALKPTLIENLEMHMDRHGKVIKSVEFEQFPPDVRQRFLTHFNQTRDLFLSLPTMPEKVAAPKVSLALRADVGESTVAKVMHRGGIPEADPNEIGNEPPLETMVSVIDQLKDAPLEHENPLVNDEPAAPAAKPKPAK